MRRTGLLAVASIGLALLSPAAKAASYDCSKAAAPDERAVCADARLSALDEVMAKAYAEARKQAEADERPKLLSDVHAFLARRRQCGTAATCLTAAYVGVLEDMLGYGSTVGVPASVSALDMVGTPPPETRALPRKEGQCVTTRIDEIGGRLEGDKTFETGTSVSFHNDGSQVSYDKVPAIVESRPGDRVLMCLTAIPKHCPPGDDRGRTYTTTNLRTHGTWSLADSQHMCGGA
jgi:uncharacterized protein YecT (DUF1311 family)